MQNKHQLNLDVLVARLLSPERLFILSFAGVILAGTIFFSWTDEWFKKVWLWAEFYNPYEDRRLWYNFYDPEKNYGMVAYLPGAEGDTCSLSGTDAEWAAADTRPGQSVAIASGASAIPEVPQLSAAMPSSIRNLTPREYRNPKQLDDRAVLGEQERDQKEEARKQVKAVKQEKINKSEKAWSKLKQILYEESRYNRKQEYEADSIGFVLFRNTDFHPVDYINTLKLMDQYDSVKPMGLKTETYKRIFDLPSQPFKAEWLKQEDFKSYDYSKYKEKIDKDSVDTHPKTEERIASIKRIFPEQISRFFLFDGELLQEYEDRNESCRSHARRTGEI